MTETDQIHAKEQAEAKDANEIEIPIGSIRLKGHLRLPKKLRGIVLFAHGSGSGRLSPRNRQVANALNRAGIGTLLFDLLTPDESQDRKNVFDIQLLSDRLVQATRWLRSLEEHRTIPLGYFGASTGAGAALWAAAELGSEISVVVSRGGRPDLAIPHLGQVTAPTLLIVGSLDHDVIDLNEEALKHIRFGKLEIVEGASHLFEEPGTLEKVSALAADWFLKNFRTSSPVLKKHLTVTEEIQQRANPLKTIEDLGSLIDSVKDSKVVMLGEASHGTKEFYQWRHLISKELIEKHGFHFIAVEGDWPPCHKVNQFVKYGEGGAAENALNHFQRWPTWMWANYEILDLIQWMRKHNAGLPESDRVGFYGLDVYSLFESIDEVIEQVGRIDPNLVARVQEWYACFDPYHRDEKAYVKSLMRMSEGCEQQVLESLRHLLDARVHTSREKQEALFDATQNARIVKNAEEYYRSMIQFNDNSWNIRDRHMMETLVQLLKHHGPDAKAIVWEHNTHIGDYRATDMVDHGDINIGGLAREQWGDEAVSLVGFGTYEGSVIASHAWAGPIEKMPVPAAKPGSYEAHFHSCVQAIGYPNYYLILDPETRQTELAKKMGHRAIGVVYDPRQERWGNYVPTSLARRYDAFIYLDKTEALTPMGVQALKEEMPETYPGGV